MLYSFLQVQVRQAHMSFLYEDTGEAGPVDPDELAAVSYDNIPYTPRRWVDPDYIPVGSPVVYAARGETGKGMLFCANAARVVLGLPFPNEDQSIRREPGRVVWVTGLGEDDPFEDMAPRLRAAIAHAVREFGLDPALAEEQTGAIRYVHDLSTWKDDSPVTLPADCPRIIAEIGKINAQSAKEGGPPVVMMVADSLSALLSEGYTIDSRQGARRVMAKLSSFARRADVAMPVIHHLTKDGKVAGSPAVLDALRLAFIIERDKVNEDVRTVVRHKSNISAAQPLRYIITGHGPGTHAEFVNAEDDRADRVSAAQKVSTPAAGSMRARLAAAQAEDREGGPFRVVRSTQAPGEPRPTRGPLGGLYATRSEARAAAVSDAGTVLAWERVEGSPAETAALTRGDGAVRAYAIGPTRRGERSASDSSNARELAGSRA